MASPTSPIPVGVQSLRQNQDSNPANENMNATDGGRPKYIKRQPWLEFINIPHIDQGSLGLRNEDEIRLFEECDDKRLGG